MANLDVSFLIDDPDFCDQIQIVRKTRSVNAYGEGQTSPTPSTITAVVAAGSGDEMVRTPDGQYVRGTITVYARSVLMASEGGFDADEVVWNGQTYIVSIATDWMHTGSGFTKAVCTLKGLST